MIHFGPQNQSRITSYNVCYTKLLRANQDGFGYFNSSAANNQITVQAWVYLIGDTPAGVEIPIVYRTVNNGKTFSMCLKDNKAYFSIGNNNNATLNTGQLPAFEWLAITGTYDGIRNNFV